MKNSKFKIGVLAYAGVLVILIVVLLIYTWNSMKKYEASQSQNVIESLIEKMESGDFSDINVAFSSKYESATDAKDIFTSQIAGKDLSYKIKSTSREVATYEIVCDDKTVATVNLKGTNHKETFKILVICDWTVDTVIANLADGENTVCVKVPNNYKVYVNDVLLGTEEQKGEAVKAFDIDLVAQYTDIPTIVTYEVKGLLNKPTLKIVDAKGNNVDLSGFSDYNNIEIGYSESEMDAELLAYVSQAAKDYSDFFTKDLPGCATSTKGIEKYFPADSMYIKLAESYRLNDMWMYSAHSGREFRNFVVDDYTVYNDELFTCTISFTKRVVLTSNKQEKLDDNNQIYYFVKIDGEWLIAALKDAE